MDDAAKMRAAIAFALLCSFSASAECKKDDFNRYVAAALRLYEALEYERAIDQVAKAKESSCGVDDDALLGMYEGTIRSDLGQADQAKVVFKEALLLKPDADLPLKVSPKVKKLFEVLRAEAKKELAPILAKQEEERRKKVAEENEKADRARREDEQRRAEDARRAEELRRAAENAKTEEARQAALAEARRLEEQRAKERPNVVIIEKPASDRPDVHEVVSSAPQAEVQLKTSNKNRVIIPLVFTGAGLVAGGVGAYFGVTGRNGQNAARNVMNDQVMRERLLRDGNQQALIADVLFGVAGAAALAAIISLFAVPSDVVSEPVR